MQNRFLNKGDLGKLLEYLQTKFALCVINRNSDNLFWKKFDPQKIDDIIINEYRPAEPLKSFIFKSKEKVLDDFKDYETKNRPLALLGAKACDLHALKVLDHVFMEGEFKDPFYVRVREESIIISADCTSFKDVCFCLAVGVTPFPKENFDLNLTEVNDGFIITVGSAKGRTLLEKSSVSTSDVTDGQAQGRQDNKDNFLNKLESNISFMKLPKEDAFKEGVSSSFDSELWDNFAAACVECGGCNVICPTCHCFLLVDQASDDKYQRLKVWDSCLMKRFAMVAGGANPRKHLSERLRNRFVKKFNFFPEILNMYACTGCGRCIEACPGDIDLREVLKESCKVRATE